MNVKQLAKHLVKTDKAPSPFRVEGGFVASRTHTTEKQTENSKSLKVTVTLSNTRRNMPEMGANTSTCPQCHQQTVYTWYGENEDLELFRKCHECGWRGIYVNGRLVALAYA